MTDNNPWGNEKFDVEAAMERLKGKFKGPKLPGFLGGGLFILVILLVWAGTGFFIVAANEQGVVKRFGAVSRVVGPGPHYHLPFPVEVVDKAEVTKIHRIEIGFRTMRDGTFRTMKEESLMLTGDENIVSLEMIVQYQINDIVHYNYNVVDVPGTIMSAAESAIREVAGKEKIDEILTTGKNRIQNETMVILQDMLQSYKAGVRIVAVQLQDVNPPDQVVAAFKDVASAREDRNRYINEAEAYENEVIPKARAQAETMLQEAEAYRAEQSEKAIGDTKRFLNVLRSYRAAPDITKQRLYLETMADILSGGEKYIFDSSIKNISPFMGLDRQPETGVKK